MYKKSITCNTRLSLLSWWYCWGGDLTNRDPAIVKAGNNFVERLEDKGETVVFLDGFSPYAVSINQKRGKNLN